MNLSENSSNHSIRPASNGYPCRLCTPLLELVHHEVDIQLEWNVYSCLQQIFSIFVDTSISEYKTSIFLKSSKKCRTPD